MPTNIDIEVFFWLAGGLCVIIGGLVTLLFNTHTDRIIGEIQTQGERVGEVKVTADKALDLHSKHLVEFHTK